MERLRQWCQRFFLSLLGNFWRPWPEASAEPKRVVMFEMTRLGDVVAGTAAIDALAAAHPGASLEFFGPQAYAPLFEGDARVSFVGLPSGFGFLKAAWALRKRLQGPELALYSLSPSARNSVLVWLSKPGQACGFLFPRAGGLGYDEAQPLGYLRGSESRHSLSGREDHMVARVAKVLGLAGLPSNVSPRLLSPAARVAGRVLLHAGANWAWRRWPLENFERLERELKARGKEVVLIRPDQQMGLKELRDLLASAELFIGNDSGPLHLAASLGTACIGLFGPNLPSRSGPWPLDKHKVLLESVPCSPCAQTHCLQPEDWCMAKLSVERVLAAV